MARSLDNHSPIPLFRFFVISLFRNFAISLVIIVLLIGSGCSPNNDNTVIITGQIEGAPVLIYLLEQTILELQKIDSALPDEKGVFQWSPNVNETGIFSLRVIPGEQVIFIASPGDSILITGNMNQDPPVFQVSGNRESSLLQSFYAYSAGNLREVDSLQRIIELNQGEDDFYELTVRIDSLFNQIWERQRSYEKEYIRENAGDFSTLLVVNYHFGMRPVLSPKTDAGDYRRVDSGLMANYPGNRHTRFFHQWLKEVK